MKKAPPDGNSLPSRHPYGPRPIGALLPAVTRAAYKTKGATGARLMADWPDIVGPALAATTMPRRFSAGTLTINCSGPVALELQHLSGQVKERINTHLGNVMVKQLRFVHEPVTSPATIRQPRRSQPEPIAIEGLPAGPLRDALAALGALLTSE